MTNSIETSVLLPPLAAAGVILALLSVIPLLRFVRLLFPSPESDSDSIEDLQARAPAAKHLTAFLWGAVGITLLVASLTIAAGWIYAPVSEQWLPGFRADPQSFMGALGIVFGIPIAFAGSVYAIYLAILGLRGSNHQVRLAQQANTFSDPAYELSQKAYNAYRRYGFLVGSLVSSYRLLKHQSDEAAYRGGDANYVDTSVWDGLCAELRALLLDEAFAVASMEAARLRDERDGTLDAQEKQHNLRRAFAVMISLLAPASAEVVGAKNSAQSILLRAVRVLTRAHSYNIEIAAGLEAVDKSTKDGTLARNTSARGNFLTYIGQWMGSIDRVETGLGLQVVARANAFAGEELADLLGAEVKLGSVVLEGKLKELFDISTRHMVEQHRTKRAFTSPRIGTHDNFIVASLPGDHSTIGELVALAKETLNNSPDVGDNSATR